MQRVDSSGVRLEEFPALKDWTYKLLERPGVEKGRHVPTPHKSLEAADMTEEQLDEKAAANRGWIMAGMKDDSK